MKFICGHEAGEPRNMGRGQARVKRLAEYFGRPCVDCASRKLESSIMQVTDLTGGRRAESYYFAKIVEKVSQLRARY